MNSNQSYKALPNTSSLAGLTVAKSANDFKTQLCCINNANKLGNLTVIVDEMPNSRALELFDEKAIIDKVSFVPEQQILNYETKLFLKQNLKRIGLQHRTNWYFQQFLKLRVLYSSFGHNEVVLVDADCFLVSETWSNKDKTILKTIPHAPRLWTRVTDSLLGVKRDESSESFVVESMHIPAKTIKNMIDFILVNINQTESDTFFDFMELVLSTIIYLHRTEMKISRDPDFYDSFSEFDLIGNYLANHQTCIIQKHHYMRWYPENHKCFLSVSELPLQSIGIEK
jgi:hypothetical protein